ncbi:MAG: radical SAM protein, partial [Acidobacteriaceae bacterium]|nr:radical SAM protein [Acidobacteriaceae bacterium]
VLKTLAERNDVHVTLTVTTMDRGLARLTEPYAPRPELRMEAVQKLTRAGIPVGVIASPVLPGITDSEENLESVAKAARQAGADQFGAHVLFLMPSAQRVFFPFVAERFPELMKRYERSYQDGAYLKGKYPERIRVLIEQIRDRVGIPSRDLARLKLFQTGMPGEAQLALF